MDISEGNSIVFYVLRSNEGAVRLGQILQAEILRTDLETPDSVVRQLGIVVPPLIVVDDVG
jgi:hypothetical protein